MLPVTNLHTNSVRRLQHSAQHKESHSACSVYGRPRALGLGQGLPSIFGCGVRVAEIKAKITGSAQWNNIPTTASFATTCALAPTRLLHNAQARLYAGQSVSSALACASSLTCRSLPSGRSTTWAASPGLYGRKNRNQTVNISQSMQTAFSHAPSCTVQGKLHFWLSRECSL